MTLHRLGRLSAPPLRLESLEDRCAPGDLGLGAAVLSLWAPALTVPAWDAVPAPAPTLPTDTVHAAAPAHEAEIGPAPVRPLIPAPAPPGSADALAEAAELLVLTAGSQPPHLFSTLRTAYWDNTGYITDFVQAWVAEGRIGNTLVPAGTFELDIGPTTAQPAQTADYNWTASPDAHPFLIVFDADTGLATFWNNEVVLQYAPTWSGDPATDAIFFRTNAVNNQSALWITNLYLYTPALGDFVPVPDPDTGEGPVTFGAEGPGVQRILQIDGTPLQEGFLLYGESSWAYATKGPDVPRQSQLAFQIGVGNWYGE